MGYIFTKSKILKKAMTSPSGVYKQEAKLEEQNKIREREFRVCAHRKEKIIPTDLDRSYLTILKESKSTSSSNH